MIVCFAIGNSDDKLSQVGWAAFVVEVHALVDHVVTMPGTFRDATRVQFAGYSPPGAPWQNALWAIELDVHAQHQREVLRSQLASLAGRYQQDSIAWWEASDAEMLRPPAVTR